MEALHAVHTDLEAAVLQGKVTPLKAAQVQRDAYLKSIRNGGGSL
jgi:hypothetical protein